jgi:hypothetical protein
MQGLRLNFFNFWCHNEVFLWGLEKCHLLDIFLPSMYFVTENQQVEGVAYPLGNVLFSLIQKHSLG